MKNAQSYSPNRDYNQFGPNGIVNLTSCSQGAPVFLSKPHFLDSDASLQDGVTGLHPDRNIHDTFLVKLQIFF